VDNGNVWRDVSDVNPVEMNTSVGVGVLFDLPIGPIRLDYGWPIRTELDHLETGRGEFHFNLGYAF
jgi:outer membrane protein insertion porin family